MCPFHVAEAKASFAKAILPMIRYPVSAVDLTKRRELGAGCEGVAFLVEMFGTGALWRLSFSLSCGPAAAAAVAACNNGAVKSSVDELCT